MFSGHRVAIYWDAEPNFTREGGRLISMIYTASSQLGHHFAS